MVGPEIFNRPDHEDGSLREVLVNDGPANIWGGTSRRQLDRKNTRFHFILFHFASAFTRHLIASSSGASPGQIKWGGQYG